MAVTNEPEQETIEVPKADKDDVSESSSSSESEEEQNVEKTPEQPTSAPVVATEPKVIGQHIS